MTSSGLLQVLSVSSTQLTASTDVAGGFDYIPAAGTVQYAGAYQVLSTTFTPTATTNYNTAMVSVLIEVI